MQKYDKKTPILTVRNLCKDFRRPNGNLFTVLEGINLELYDGEFLAIVGLSGSGKSTLLRCMAGLLTPDRGVVSYASLSAENRQQSAFVFQNFALFPWMTIRENIAVSIPNKIPQKEKDERVDNVIQMVGLWGFEDAYPRELSGGMRQRVSFARAMASDPMIMFMDEPFSALDPLTSESLRAELLRIWMQQNRKIRASVLVTHRFEEALQLANRIIILSSNPGTIFKTIEINLPHPRVPNSSEFKNIEEELERSFGELHLGKVTDETEFDHHAHQIAHKHHSVHHMVEHNKEDKPSHRGKHKEKRLKPLINTNLTLVEGLVSRLNNETEDTDLYDLCEEMGQSVDQVLPAVAAAETLGFIHTPGIQVILTEAGKLLALEHDPDKRSDIMQDAVKKVPIIAEIYNLVLAKKEDGLDAEIVLDQMALMLPFEDHDLQFKTLLKWCRHANLLIYDSDEEKLFIPE